MYTNVIEVAAVVDSVQSLIGGFGISVLIVVFLIEGALLGKLLPTDLIFPLGLAGLGTTPADYVLITLATVVSSSLGQSALFWYLYGEDITTLEKLPYLKLASSQIERAEKVSDRYGLAAVFILNLFPLVRGTGTLPAATRESEWSRFLLASVGGNLVHFTVFALLTLGVVSII